MEEEKAEVKVVQEEEEDKSSVKRRRDYDSRDFKRSRNPNRICRELYGSGYRYSERIEGCVPDF